MSIGRVARGIRRSFADGGDGLAFLELGLLDRLDRTGSTSPGALSDNEGAAGRAIAKTLRHLEPLGLVARSQRLDRLVRAGLAAAIPFLEKVTSEL